MLKTAHIGCIGGGIGAAVHRVDGDQVYVGTHAPDQVCQLFCTFIRIIDAPDHGIFKADPAAGGVLIAAHCLDELVHRVGVVHRHHAAADLVVGRMQGYRQGKLQFMLRQPVDPRHQAAGGQADIPHPDIDPLRGGDQMQEFQHLVKVIQRLANAHQHDMGDALPDIPLRCIDLGADLMTTVSMQLPSAMRRRYLTVPSLASWRRWIWGAAI